MMERSAKSVLLDNLAAYSKNSDTNIDEFLVENTAHYQTLVIAGPYHDGFAIEVGRVPPNTSPSQIHSKFEPVVTLGFFKENVRVPAGQDARTYLKNLMIQAEQELYQHKVPGYAYEQVRNVKGKSIGYDANPTYAPKQQGNQDFLKSWSTKWKTYQVSLMDPKYREQRQDDGKTQTIPDFSSGSHWASQDDMLKAAQILLKAAEDLEHM